MRRASSKRERNPRNPSIVKWSIRTPWGVLARPILTRFAPSFNSETSNYGRGEPGNVPLEEDGDLSEAGDHGLAAPPRDRADDLPRRRLRRHDDQPGNRSPPRVGTKDTQVVDLSELGLDEAGADQCHGDAGRRHLV